MPDKRRERAEILLQHVRRFPEFPSLESHGNNGGVRLIMITGNIFAVKETYKYGEVCGVFVYRTSYYASQ